MSCCDHNETVTVEITVPPCHVAVARRFLATIGEPDTEENVRKHFTSIIDRIWVYACWQQRFQEGRCDPGGGPLGLDGEEPIFRD